ncbi:HAMP domain-containing sensor histidine kinase [Dyadobacter sp. CY356]|uniref:sensor histidine kinase n=1 Tax=Dyadobacter sp. CY356 TaxID=2906442 RepID=UPI001F240320|nr:HAMP domain-containing sensor histidine kinase [Dyadobacter sp. CY356]MCF0054857.1 ATP-binding protein [Dyadobacter sp. CY356]
MKRVLLTLLVIFLWPGRASAQKNYYVEHYSGDNGLPQNSVKTLSADSEGFIWMGTEDGLVRYDGSRFYVFNKFNLGISNTRSIFTQPSLRHYPGHDKNGQHTKGRNAISYAYFMGGESVRIEKGKAVFDMNYSRDQAKRLEPFGQKVPNYLQATGYPNFLDKLDVSMPQYLIRAGNTSADFYLCDSTQIQYFENWKLKYSLPFKRDNLWGYFVMGQALYYFDEQSGSITLVSEHETEKKVITGAITEHPLYKSNGGRISIYWNNVADETFLNIGDDLYILEAQPDGSLQTRLLAADFDLKSNGIERIYYDYGTKKIFLGSATEGLFILTPHQFRTVSIKGDIRDNIFYGQVPYTRNSVITADGRIVGYDPLSGKVTDTYFAPLRKVNDRDKLLIVKDAQSKSYWTKNGNVLLNVGLENPYKTQSWAFKYNVETMHQDEKGGLWIGAAGEGLFYKDAVKVPELFIKGPFGGTSVIFLNDNHLLVGTIDGLYDIEVRTKKYHLVPGTEKIHFKAIFRDKDKNIWLTALDKGMMLIKPDGCLISFPLDANRYLASPHGIVPERDYFWIPTNKGLFQISRTDLLTYAQCSENEKHGVKTSNRLNVDELYYEYHSKEEGFLTNEFNGSCGPGFARLENGYISLPSLNGLVWFKPERIRNNQTDGAIVLDRAEENRRNLVISNDSLYFPLNPTQVKLYFTSAYFGNPYNMRMSYALVKDGLVPGAEDWIPIRNEHNSLEFSSLSSGNYTLIVRKLNGFGVNNYTIKKIYFVVPLLWYQTWWAMVLTMLLLLAVVYFYNLWKLKKVKFENARLEEVVARRTERLNKTMTDLEESKNEMSQQVHMLSRLLTSMSHDIQSPLNFLALTSGNIPKMIQKGQYQDVAMLGEMISDSSRSMSNLLGGLMDYIKAHVYENSLHFEAINLRELVDRKFGIFKNMILENGTEFSNEIPVGTEVFCDYQMLGIMIHNLIDNAAKFTRDGVIRVYFNANAENEKELVISNSTLGVPMAMQEMINSTEKKNVHLPVRQDLSSPPAPRTSLGLLIVKEIAALIGINLKVTQTDVTSFHLIFPCDK